MFAFILYGFSFIEALLSLHNDEGEIIIIIIIT